MKLKKKFCVFKTISLIELQKKFIIENKWFIGNFENSIAELLIEECKKEGFNLIKERTA